MPPASINDELLNLLPSTADVYLQKIDLARQSALLIQFDEQRYRAASFLDDRILTPATKGTWAPLSLVTANDTGRNCRPLHFIFHTGHVGSTLLSRLLEEAGGVLALREPLPLRTLADSEDALGQVDSLLSEAQFATLRATLCRLWSRGYDSTQMVVVKATSSAGRIAPSLLNANPTSRAVYLNIALEPYLATLLAGQNSAIDLRGHAPVRVRRIQSRIAARLTPLHALSPGELAAMSWLAETWNQRDAVGGAGARILSLDFEEMLGDLEPTLARVLGHFGLALEPNDISKLAQSPVLARYSKATEFTYSPQIRTELLVESRRLNREEIRRGLEWIEHLARAERTVADALS